MNEVNDTIENLSTSNILQFMQNNIIKDWVIIIVTYLIQSDFVKSENYLWKSLLYSSENRKLLKEKSKAINILFETTLNK
jgi:hypothetical protein